MSKLQMTLGQAIDEMLSGESVVIGVHRYKILNDQFLFKPNNRSEHPWMRTEFNSIELNGSKEICYKWSDIEGAADIEED